MKQEMRYSVVRRGTSLVLAATLATGMVPAIALAQDAGSNGNAPVAEQVEGQKEFDLEIGKAYTVNVAWSSMAGTFLDKTVQLVWDGTNYTIDISSSNMSFFGYMEVDGKRADLVTNDEGKQVFRVTVSDFGQKNCKTLVTMMGREVEFTLDFDTSTLPTKEVAADSYESGYTVYFKGEKYDTSKQFQDKVKVAPKDGVYYVELTANSLGEKATLGDVTYDGNVVDKTVHEDGSVTYTLPLPSVDGTYDFTFSYTITATNRTNTHDFQLVLDGGTYSGGTTDPGQDEQKVDKTALNAAIAAAKAIEQGKKTDEAFSTLQGAIATAEKAASSDKIPQAGVDAATEQLKAAIKTFNASKDAETPAPTPSEDQAVTTADGFKLVAGKEYTLPVSFINATTGEQSTAANFMEATATVSYVDGSYSVTVTPNAQGKQFLTAMAYGGKSAVQNADGSFTISGVPAINKDITVSVTMPGGTVDMGVRLDTTSLPTTSGKPIKPSNPNDNAGGNGGNNGQGNGGTTTTDPAGQKAEQGFQVGHTYQVPVSWLKQNSSETSMAAKYFGDTALVRPQSDGTFKVSFSATSEGASHIISLAYNGSTLAKSGNQYTVSIPKADSDTVVPISMTIKEMEQLGGGAQVADMHLKLSQAKDLGTGQDSVVASSSTTMAQTGDVAAGVAGAAAVAALVAGGVAVASRRRSKRQ